MQKKLPVFLLPTTIVCVDDDNIFLRSLTNYLEKRYLLKTFQNSEECLDFFDDYQEQVNVSHFFETFSGHQFHGDPEHEPIDFNFSKFCKINKIENKKNEVAILMADFNLPGKNGIELCESLRDLPIKKILLTGKLTLHEAVKALNNGIIDCYIDKDDKNLVNEISKYINILTRKYFYNKGLPLLNHFDVNGISHLILRNFKLLLYKIFSVQ